jgi:drug/metabolite transporter (DMT)-like permease
VFQKQLTAGGNHPFVVIFISYFSLSLFCIVIALRVPWQALPRQFWTYSVLAGIAGTLGNAFLVKALQKGDLSILGPVNSYKSVVGILVGILILGEIPSATGLLGVVIIIFGSYFVLGTTKEGFRWALLKRPDIRFRIWAMILTAIEAVFIKKIILASSTGTAFLSWCWFGCVFSLILVTVYKLDLRNEIRKLEFPDLLRYGLLILCVGTMQYSTNYVFDHMDVGYALSLFQLSSIVSVLLGYRLFSEKEISKKLLGSAIMIAGSVIIILLKNH